MKKSKPVGIGLKIENFTSNTFENIKQDMYSTIIRYNIAFSYNNVCNKLVENKMVHKGKINLETDDFVYKVDFAN